MSIHISFPDGSVSEYPEGITPLEIAKGKLNPVACRINGELSDLTRAIFSDVALEFVTFDSPEGKAVFWHSTSHILAQAVKRLFPEAKLAIGPAIEEGFYYDFDVKSPFTEEEIARIEEEMAKIIEEDIPFVREEISKKEAENIFLSLGEEYKLELLSDIDDKNVSIYRNGDFVDLCRGPHLPSTGWVKFLKLTSVAGAYWRGDERNKMLQRIYGISFPKKKELKEYLHKLDEAKKRDHRILGTKLNLFMMDDSIGPGLVIWKPEGAVVRGIIEDYWKSIHRKWGYQYIYTPHIARLSLWETSGHTEFYSDNMFQPIDVEGQMYQ
ncbi:threonine--tRNA ligase, partial [bacterium]